MDTHHSLLGLKIHLMYMKITLGSIHCQRNDDPADSRTRSLPLARTQQLTGLEFLHDSIAAGQSKENALV